MSRKEPKAFPQLVLLCRRLGEVFINTFSAHSALGPFLALDQPWPWSKLVLECFIPRALQNCLGAEAERGFALGAGPCSAGRMGAAVQIQETGIAPFKAAPGG